jgi:hypothetical protein
MNQPNQTPAEVAKSAKTKTSETYQEATDQVGVAVRLTQEKAQQAADQLKAQAQQAAGQLKEKAGEVAQQARDRGMTFLDDQKRRIVSELGSCSNAVRRAAERFEEESEMPIARYVTAAANQLDNVREHLKVSSLGELVDDAEDLARQRPELVLGGLFIAGFAVGRFLKASNPRRRSRPGRSREARRSRPAETPSLPESTVSLSTLAQASARTSVSKP